jgi:dihydrofolate reductase
MITIIAAMTPRGVIGKGNELPWNIPDELKHFRKTTQASTVIMGLKTFQSIGRPLPNRHNIVLATAQMEMPGVSVCLSIDQALEVARGVEKPIFIIGGAYTYAQFLPLADRMILSYIRKEYDGDVYFPAFAQKDWQVVGRVDYPEFEVVEYVRGK